MTEEFHPLADGEVVELDDGARATLWAELTHLVGAEPVASYRTGPHVGSPAITRHDHGTGAAWYLGTRLEPDDLAALLGRIITEAGIEPVVPGLPAGVEAVRRSGPQGSYVFLVNHGDRTAMVDVPGTDLLTGVRARLIRIDGGATAILAEDGRQVLS